MKTFKKVYIEITSVCNLSCSFCPQTERTPRFMQPDEFERTLEQIAPHTCHIYLHVKGEPLLHPKLDRLLDISAAKGFRVNLTTNGALIAKAGGKLLGKPALRQVNFSLHSFDGHPGSDNRERYLGDITAFARKAAAEGVLISYRLWNLDSASSASSATSASAETEPPEEERRNRETLEALEKEYGVPFRIEEKVRPGSGVRLADRVYVNQEYEFRWPGLHEPEGDKRGFCHGLRNQAAILADGTVVPCCLDGEGVIRLGNLNQTPFSEIIEGERANRLVDGFSHREAVEELCRKCGYRERFGGGAG